MKYNIIFVNLTFTFVISEIPDCALNVVSLAIKMKRLLTEYYRETRSAKLWLNPLLLKKYPNRSDFLHNVFFGDITQICKIRVHARLRTYNLLTIFKAHITIARKSNLIMDYHPNFQFKLFI